MAAELGHPLFGGSQRAGCTVGGVAFFLVERYLGSIMVASDDGSLCLFEADPAVDLTSAVTPGGNPFERFVEVALTSPADAAGAGQRHSPSPT